RRTSRRRPGARAPDGPRSPGRAGSGCSRRPLPAGRCAASPSFAGYPCYAIGRTGVFPRTRDVAGRVPSLGLAAGSSSGAVLARVRGILVLLALLLPGYTFLMLNYSYSTGERAGVLQKLSRKGWVCKTWEGELAMTTVPGVAPVLW